MQEVTARGGGISAEGGTQTGGSCCPSVAGEGCESSFGVLVQGDITLVNLGTGIGAGLHDSMITALLHKVWTVHSGRCA